MSPSPSPPLRCAAVRGSVSSSRQRSDEQPSPHRRPHRAALHRRGQSSIRPDATRPGSPASGRRRRCGIPPRRTGRLPLPAPLPRTDHPHPRPRRHHHHRLHRRRKISPHHRRQTQKSAPTPDRPLRSSDNGPRGGCSAADLGRYNRLTKCTTESGTAGISNPAPTDAARAPTSRSGSR